MTGTSGSAHRSPRAWLGAVLALGALGFLFGCSGNQDLPRNEQTVEGVTIDLGVLPAELVQGHSTTEGDPKAMHGGTPAGEGSNHVVVALFDAKTGARITDARVRAGVGSRSYDHDPDKWLAPMQIAGTTTYGNFFLMPGREVYRIHLQIYRAEATQPIRADFAYERPSGS
jgi:hypothetical protein